MFGKGPALGPIVVFFDVGDLFTEEHVVVFVLLLVDEETADKFEAGDGNEVMMEL